MKIRKCKYNFGNNNDGVFSTINGYATETNNFGETAVGILNKSTLDPDTFTSPDVVTSSKATLFSVGNGSDNVRKNAFEIKANGDTYINGVGGYDGTNSEDATSVGESIQSVQDSSNKFAEDIESIHIEKSTTGDTYVLKVAGEDRGTITNESGVSFTPGNGLQLVDTNLSVKIDPTSESYLTAEQDGLKISGIDAKFGDYLPLSGGVVTGELTAIRIVTGNIASDGIELDHAYIKSIDNTPVDITVANSFTDKTLLSFNNDNANLISFSKNGVTLSGKTSSDILNASGGTISIDDLKTQLGVPDTSNLATKDELSGYLPLTGGTIKSSAEGSSKITISADSTNQDFIAITDTSGIGMAAYGPSGVTIYNKKQTDLLNATSGTVSIDDIVSQVDLSGYLPLTGGTLTGALDGPQAQFGGLSTTILTLGNSIIRNDEQGLLNILTIDTTDKPLIYIKTNSANLLTVTRDGIKLGSETDTNLLLNAAGSTTSVSSIATQVQASIVDSAPETLDTLNELAAALGDDPNFATTVTNQIAQKADKTTATTSADGLMSAADKTKLDSLSTVATSGSYNDLTDAPTIPTVQSGQTGTNTNYVYSSAADEGYRVLSDISCTRAGDVVKLQGRTWGMPSNSSLDLVTLPLASSSMAGLMSTTDKQKLDGLSNYTLPTASATQLGGVRVGDGLEITGEGVLNCTIDPGSGTVSWGNIQGKPTFATVATSGLYSDLTGTPDLSNYVTSTQLTSVAGSNTYTGANYISKETNLTDAVVQLDEEIKATNDNLALEHANAEATYVKKTGDTITGDLTVSGGKHILFEGTNTAGDNRRLRIGHQSIDVLARRNPEGWSDNLFAIYNETGDTKIETALGAWGEGDQINYLYIGGTYNNPKVVITRGGKLGVGQNYASEMLEVNGNAKANNFIGNLQGNADTATKATQDGNGDVIAETYVKKTQLKTINSQSLLGEGNIEIQVEGGGIADAPSDGKLYGRKNAQWTEVTLPEVEVPTKVSELTNDSGFQTEAQVSAKISALVDSAPETLDTLNELAAALGDDPNFATTITTQLGNKLDTSTYNSDKATFALKSELPDMSNYALKSEVPNVESITTTDIDELFS